jgi:hypothetical protein
MGLIEAQDQVVPRGSGVGWINSAVLEIMSRQTRMEKLKRIRIDHAACKPRVMSWDVDGG